MCCSNFLNDDFTLNIENGNYLKLLGKRDTCESRIPFCADPNNRTYSVNAKNVSWENNKIIDYLIFFFKQLLKNDIFKKNF